MALSRPTCVSTWASAATSPIQSGVEGTDSGFTWMVTDVCVILDVCPPLRETVMNLFPYKETHSCALSPVSLLTAQLYNLVAHPVGEMKEIQNYKDWYCEKNFQVCQKCRSCFNTAAQGCQ